MSSRNRRGNSSYALKRVRSSSSKSGWVGRYVRTRFAGESVTRSEATDIAAAAVEKHRLSQEKAESTRQARLGNSAAEAPVPAKEAVKLIGIGRTAADRPISHADAVALLRKSKTIAIVSSAFENDERNVPERQVCEMVGVTKRGIQHTQGGRGAERPGKKVTPYEWEITKKDRFTWDANTKTMIQHTGDLDIRFELG